MKSRAVLSRDMARCVFLPQGQINRPFSLGPGGVKKSPTRHRPVSSRNGLASLVHEKAPPRSLQVLFLHLGRGLLLVNGNLSLLSAGMDHDVNAVRDECGRDIAVTSE
jgi:hypothetical protein